MLRTDTIVETAWRSLPDLFADQAMNSPDAVALIFEGQSLTYATLAAHANRLARLLIERGVGPDSIVPILLDRSIAMVVAILGVLAAGGGYMPVDPEAPAARTSSLLEDSGAAIMLTSTTLAERSAIPGAIDVLCVDDPVVLGHLDSLPAAPISDDDRREPLRPHHLSFVIYTSGTTGAPKGSGNTQAGIVNCLHWLLAEMRLTTADRVLQQTTLIFDMAVLEIFLPLISGGAVVLARPGGHRNPAYIARLIQAQAVTLVFFVPTMLLEFLQEESAPGCSSLTNIVAAGEVLTGYAQALCHAMFPVASLWNGYGPSEAAVLVTLWRCRRDDKDTAPPIGRPCWRTALHILDDSLVPVAAGSPGELFVAGEPLSRGYLGRPELTAEKFVPCPFGPAGALMYRTGDIARLRDDGSLEFHGRRDSQVKLNGVRIELGEVEAAIAGLPGVSRVAVIARILSGETRLIAYIIAAPGSRPPGPADLRRALTDLLPRYMVPSFFVLVDRFPLTATGKLSARDLPDPEVGGGRAPHRTAANALEAEIARLFGELTGAERVGVDQDFFELGGTSLTAMRLVARLRSQSGLTLPIGALIDCPTPAGLAAALQRDPASDRTDAGSRPRVFVFPGAGGQNLGLAALSAACADAFDMRVIDHPDWATICRETLDFEQILEVIVRNVAESAPTGDVRLAGYSLGGVVAYGVALAMASMGRTVAFVGLIDSEAPAPLPAGPFVDRVRGLGGRLMRIWRTEQIRRSLFANLLTRTPPRLLTFAPALLALLPPRLREQAEFSMGNHLMTVLTRRWQRHPDRQSEHLDAPMVLFRAHDGHDGDARYEGWARRAARLDATRVDGDHFSMLSGAHLETFASAFRAKVQMTIPE